MSGTVSSMSIICMAISCLAGFAIPVVLFLYFYKKKGADVLPFFVGCGVMLVFALILEASCHQLILGSPAGKRLSGNVWLYACYGGLMAGLFEETGRFLAFMTVLGKYRGKDINALMYGAGHGGFESIVILGISMVSNIALALLMNSGKTGPIAASLPEEVLLQLKNASDTLIHTPSPLFLVGIAERVLAVTLHIALSVLVWFAVKDRNRWYLYPAAVLIHFAVDAFTVLLSGLHVPILAIEGVILVLTVLTCILASKIWASEKANHA